MWGLRLLACATLGRLQHFAATLRLYSAKKRRGSELFHHLSRVAAFSALLSAGLPAHAQSDPGSYLAARQAALSNDFAEAARYFTQSLISDPQNPNLMENALAAYVMLGQMAQAIPVAQAMTDAGVESQLAHLVSTAHAAQRGDWQAIFEALEANQTVSPLVDGLNQSWAAMGLGNMDQALASFDEVMEGDGMRSYGAYHKALALASVGDFEGANDILSDLNANGRVFSARAALAQAQILSQLDRNADAREMLQAIFGTTVDPGVSDMQARLDAGETLPYTLVNSPQEGISEVAYMIAGLLQGEARHSYTLQYARVAQYLYPDSTDAILLSASLLNDMQRYQLAADTFAMVPATDLSFPTSELGRIDALRQIDQDDAAIEVARALTRSHPELPFAHAKLADTLRSTSQFDEAFAAYTTALELYDPRDPVRWRVLYTRAITAHAQDNWPTAEADFRAALELRPDQPQVLNYLGYSLVERGEKLDEALQMIETAVAGQPDNGAIVDSLGWVLFQLGRYEESVVHMERAASLEAVDPIVNDHLGDVYWAVGRQIEAAFQWNRALSFDPDDELATRIRLKLEIGLDAVLEAEGTSLMQLANDEG